MDRDRRIELHDILVDVLGSDNVYFQPPESKKLSYPCIVYSRDNVRIRYADNKNYIDRLRYEIKYIDSNPDSGIPKKLRELRYCSFNRHYKANNLYHDVFTIFY